MKNIQSFFEEEREKTLHQIDQLQKAITHLRYEGKAFRKKNLKMANKTIKDLGAVLTRHWEFQEKIIFPFLLVHIPRHEAAIRFLETEHEDIRRHKQELKNGIRKLSVEGDRLEDGKIYERGVCLVSLLRHHVGFETRNIHRSIRKELREDEKKAMRSRISRWVRKKTGPGG